MTAIASTTLTSQQLTVTFSSIPSIYDDLRLVIYDAGDPTYSFAAPMQFNSDTGSNYGETRLYGDGSSFYALGQSSVTSLPIQTRQEPSATIVEILSYANSTQYKNVLIRTASNNNSSGETRLSVGLWRSTAAINSITLTNSSLRLWAIGSVFAIYGITKAT